jgi:hypothetical protein
MQDSKSPASGDASETGPPQHRRAWIAPALTRIDAGDAENGIDDLTTDNFITYGS